MTGDEKWILNNNVKWKRLWNKQNEPPPTTPKAGLHSKMMMLYAAAAAAKSLQSCLTARPHRRQPTKLPSLGFFRQEHWSGLPFPSPMRESEVAQSCLTLSDPMDCSLLGSSVHGIFQARVLEWVASAFSG